MWLCFLGIVARSHRCPHLLVCVRRLSVNIDSDGTISAGDQSVEKGDLIVTFNFDGERDVGVN